MKKLKWSVLLGITLGLGFVMFSIQCTKSTEDKMIKKIESTRFLGESKIVSVKVTDTIYSKEVVSSIKDNTIALKTLQEKYKVFCDQRDSIRKNHNDSTKWIHIEYVFDSLRVYDKWISMVSEKNDLFNDILPDNYVDKTICGYKATISYQNGMNMDFILETDYDILCPSFMMEPVDSMLKFKPNDQHRKNHGFPSEIPDIR